MKTYFQETVQPFPFLLSICKRLEILIVKVEFLGGRLILSHKINDFFFCKCHTKPLILQLDWNFPNGLFNRQYHKKRQLAYFGNFDCDCLQA